MKSDKWSPAEMREQANAVLLTGANDEQCNCDDCENARKDLWLLDALAEREREIGELKSDGERIAWLEANEFGVCAHREGIERAEIWWTVVTRRSKAVTHPNTSWRAAVDDARRKAEC